MLNKENESVIKYLGTFWLCFPKTSKNVKKKDRRATKKGDVQR